MFVIGYETTLNSGEPLDIDGVTDIVEAIVDGLDDVGVIPTVRTQGTGDKVPIWIEVVVDSEDLDFAIASAVAHIDAGLHAASHRFPSLTLAPVERRELVLQN